MKLDRNSLIPHTRHPRNGNLPGAETDRSTASHWPTAAGDAFDRLTYHPINYWAGFGVDAVGVAVFLYFGARSTDAHATAAAAAVALGYLGWTLFEYGVHRFLFHGRWPALASGHLAHHAAPRRTIGLPFFLALAIALALFGICSRIMPEPYAFFAVAGAYFGWLSYGILHHAEHATDLSLSPYRHLRRHHLLHHASMSANFGVSTTCWDHVFGTHVATGGRHDTKR